MEHETKNFFWRQFSATIPSLLVALTTGMIFGYTATLLPELQSLSSDIPISSDVASWIASLPPLFMALGCLIGGPIMHRLGRKIAFFILCVPNFVGWIIIFFAPNTMVLLAGRFLGGISAGMSATVSIAYIAETSEPKYRGVFLSGPSVTMTFGIFFIHFWGTFTTWRTTALFASMFPILAFITLFFVPESPSWYISENRLEDGLRSFTWLRGDSAQPEFDEIWKEHWNTGKSSVTPTMLESFRQPEFIKPLLIIVCCFLTMQFSGVYVVAFYSVTILEMVTGCNVNEYVLMSIIDVLRLAIALLAAFLLRVFKRKTILIISGIGSTISAFILAALLHFSFTSSWISIPAFVCYIFFVSFGIAVIPWCVAGELFPLRYRSLGTSLNTSFNFILLFVVVKVAPETLDRFGIHGTFFFYGLACMFGTFVLSLVLPETKDRTLIDIEKYFRSQEPEQNITEQTIVS